ARMGDAPVLETHGSNPFRQGLREVDVSCARNGADLLGHGLVVDGVLQAVQTRIDVAGEPDIDAHRLRLALLMAMHADAGQELEIANEDTHGPAVHSTTPLVSAVRQIRC